MRQPPIPVVGPTFYPDTGLTMEHKKTIHGTRVYKLIKYPGLILGEVRIPPIDIEEEEVA